MFRRVLSAIGLIVLFTFGFFTSPATAEMLLFSEENSFHGCLDCSSSSSNSICNKNGIYGSTHRANSIWNKNGSGSRYTRESPFNRNGNGLKIVDIKGNFSGYFSIGSSGEREFQRLLENIWEATNGDYSEMRNLFCSLR